MKLRLRLPHLRRGDDLVVVRATREGVEVIATVGLEQITATLAEVADTLASGDYTVSEL